MFLFRRERNAVKRAAFAGLVLLFMAGALLTSCDDGPTGPMGPAGARSYLVTFNSFGTGAEGFVRTVAVGVLSGNAVSIPAGMNRSEFGAVWYTDPADPESWWDFTTPITENITLYARWFPFPADLQGTWYNAHYGSITIITDATFTDVTMGLAGNIVNIRPQSTSNTGYITIRFTEVRAFDDAFAPADPILDHYDLGRYYVIHYRNLAANAVETSGAFIMSDPDFDWAADRRGGKATRAEAEIAYTVPTGAFDQYTAFVRQ